MQIWKYNSENTNLEAQAGKFKSENTKHKTLNRTNQVGEYKSKNTTWTNSNIKCNSGNTIRKHTTQKNRKLQTGTYTWGNIKRKSVMRKI